MELIRIDPERLLATIEVSEAELVDMAMKINKLRENKMIEHTTSLLRFLGNTPIDIRTKVVADIGGDEE